MAGAGLAAARAVADAVLYEGYLLYPYRRSSGKNRVRWQFGVLAPRPWVRARGGGDTSVAGSADAWRQRTECLLEAPDSAVLEVRARFLRPIHRGVERRCEDGSHRPVDELEVDGQCHVSFDEAEPNEFDLVATVGELRERPKRLEVVLAGGEEIERLGDAGRIVRRRWPISALVSLGVAPAPAPFPLLCARLTIENSAPVDSPAMPRAEVLRTSLVATHALIQVRGGAFLSLLEPPAWAASAAKDCRNEHTFPVLAGSPGDRDIVLSSPILMYDYPAVSPESPGDLFDATEIDEILSLRALTLTDQEKREARATDPRAAAIVDRVDDLPREMFPRLHGALRSVRPVNRTDEPVGDGALARGSRVRLNPRAHGADVQDMFLAGRTARVAEVLRDVDGGTHVAVTLDGDPVAELHGWQGRRFHFRPDEVQPLGGEG